MAFATPHALMRYREFYPEASGRQVALTFDVSDEMNADVAKPFIGRDYSRRTDSGRYRLHPERTGVFVYLTAAAAESNTDTILTFIRFYSFEQYDLAVRLYGEREALTGFPPWAGQVADRVVVNGQRAFPEQFKLSSSLKKRGATVELARTWNWKRLLLTWEREKYRTGMAGRTYEAEWVADVMFPLRPCSVSPRPRTVCLFDTDSGWRMAFPS